MTVPPFPEPPAGSRALPTASLAAGQPLYRVHAKHYTAVFFNPSSDYRFNAPAAEFGVLYAAVHADGAFIETFCRTLDARPPLVTTKQLEARALSVLSFDLPIRLVDLTGPGLAGLGIDNRISTCEDYPLAQRWARWFWAHPERVDGLLYRSRHDPEEHCVALFSGRAQPTTSSTTDFASAGPLLARLLAKYDVAVL